MKRASLVMTTINTPNVLKSYYENFQRFGVLDQVQAIVIPDLDTPLSTYEQCEVWRQKGFDVVCPTDEEQSEFLKSISVPCDFIPWHSDNRRNVGYLMALRKGVDFVISIDDDNYALKQYDVFSLHGCVCSGSLTYSTVANAHKWHNPCKQLLFDDSSLLPFPRGYPCFARAQSSEAISCSTQEDVEVSINEGLWIGSPDIDGMCWCSVGKIKSAAYRWASFVLASDTWAPVNSQNTAVRADVIPAYWFVRMEGRVNGMKIARFGDIFQGYLAEACAKHLGHGVRFGGPIADHLRNSHSYLKDAADEMACVLLLEEFLPWLIEQKLSGSRYNEVYECLAELLQQQAEKFTGFAGTSDARTFWYTMAERMKRWTTACKTLGA